ncbi:hypothetical protein WL93_26645 [Burkholderia diffusa]|uniref:relaxase/mobilization nuclease domain-containing protein n=1 Tax=Burkholderia diffusa TaxID=488732 RepID=UPI00075C51ED|nr:relaxase/mobilization nuclease domain-containing protein [Burkholderia diffusa]KWF77593.1 hypothetical protein WL93_26645 [Burkholderia diffusa]
MSIIESEFGTALSSPVKRKSNNTRKLRNKAARVAKGAPEVMVKVTGFGKGAKHVQAHLDYITRNGQVDMENDRGEVFTGKDQVRGLFKEWAEDFGDSKRHKNQRDTMHLVLSMPEGTEPEAVRDAVRHFAKNTFGHNHEYVFALHTDEPHPHCHVTVKCLGFDGRRLNPRKADLQAWREGFAEAMQDQGYEAEATPRRARGVVRKAEKSVIRHIERGDEKRPPRTSKVKAAQIKEAAEDLTAEARGQAPKPQPWEEKIKARQTAVRRAWLAAAEALEQPKQPILYKKELRNERPDYDHLDAGRVRGGSRLVPVWADVRQPGTQKPRPQKPTVALAGLRNLSSVDLVHQQGTVEMLLRPDARHRVGQPRRGAADHDLRRARAGDYGDARGAERVNRDQADTVDDKTLAARIRGFVEGMPSIDTQRHETKRKLLDRFGRAPDRSQDAGIERPAQPAAPAPTPTRDKDADR